MDSVTRFQSLDQLTGEKARLDAVRKHHGARLERHWSALKDHDVRGLLLRDAASDVLRSWKPTRLLAGLFGGGSLTSALGSAVFRRGGLSKRIFFFAASLIVPWLLQRASSLSMEEIMQHVRTTIDRIRERMSQEATQEEEPPAHG